MKIYILIILILSLCNCKPINNLKSIDDTVQKKQDSLAFELCQIYGLDQGVRNSPGIPRKWDFIHPIDSFNFERLIKFVKQNGYPSKKLLGEKNWEHECVSMSSFANLLHNPHRLINEKEYFNLFFSEVEKGNLHMDNFISFLDKYYWVRKDSLGNRKLLYGSQFGKPCSKYRKKSDSVRAEIGLPPLHDSMFIECKTKL